ncbi:DUF2199 domain-containing protein [Hwanghaeella grinnelliae]|nr:DUF2199 domain-containing protein [Hwanghaeella grinnelliae]
MQLFGINLGKKRFEFRCSGCGKMHRGSPSISYPRPIQYYWIPEDERTQRIKDSDDFCIISHTSGTEEDLDFFIRGTLEIPIHGVDDPFIWGVWVSQSEANFERYLKTYDSDQTGLGSFGWLTVTMPYYNQSEPGEELANVECNVEWGAARPKIYVREYDHPLFFDQQNGLPWDKAVEIAQLALHVTDD